MEALPKTPATNKKRWSELEAPSSSPPNEPLKVPKRSEISPGSLQSPVGSISQSSDLTPKATYKERTNSGMIILDVPSSVAATAAGAAALSSLSSSAPRCTVGHVESEDATAAVGIQQPFRYMFTTVEQRSAALDRSFTVMQEQLFKHAGLPAEALSLRTAVGVPSQDTVVCFGRVCCEAAEGKINKTSVVLEGGRMEGGQRVKLVLNELAAYALFPGQFVVVEGLNSSGGRMVVTKLCEGVPRPLATSPGEVLARLHHSAQPGCQGGAPLRLVVGCGPFCGCDNLDYEPLRDLLHAATKGAVGGAVDVLILTGPFVDANHPAVAKGAVEMTAEDGAAETVDLATLFYYKVSSLLEALYDEQPELALQIVLVPSLNDAHHDHVYPQPPLRDHVPGGVPSPFFPDEKLFRLDLPRTQGPLKRVHVVGNPSLLTINEVVVAVTSTDVLMHLGKEEIALRPVASNRLERLVEHLVLQQSFYPVYPAPSGSDAPPLDLKFNDKWRLPVSPDLLLTPSRLATFARRLPNGTLALNPGQLAKGNAGGTYAVLTVHPLPKDHAVKAHAGSLPHQVADRTAVQIKRI